MNNDVQAVRSLGQTHVGAIVDSSRYANLSTVKVRRAAPEDADVCGRICYEAFTTLHQQHQFSPDFPSAEVAIGLLHMLFSHPQFYCVVAEINGQIVGSNCMDERSVIGGIGPISIAPTAQNRSIGRLLMRAVMNRAADSWLCGNTTASSGIPQPLTLAVCQAGFCCARADRTHAGSTDPAKPAGMDGSTRERR